VSWQLFVLGPAEEDICQAVSYYESVAPEQVTRFLDNIQTVINDVERYPFASEPQPNGLRRRSVKGFPYSVWADLDEASQIVAIVGVVHQKRNPTVIARREQSNYQS
jgi:plasmid stabilization system protein ParE